MTRVTCVTRMVLVGVFLGAYVVSAPGASAAPSKLMGMLPEGFSSSNCDVKTPKAPAIESVGCDQSSVSGGPAGAAFSLFGNLDDMNTAFDKANVATSSTCPGNTASPGPWSYGSGGKNGGQRECGTATSGSTKYAVVLWSDNSKLRTALVMGSDITSLYQWWKAKSG